MNEISQSAKVEHLTYRPDIDGLRAVAVLLVLGFHIFPDWVTGGFIGVDIFFVISGYLITYILIDKASTNSLSIIDFYSRRINRIFPALIFVLFSLFIFGWFGLFYDEYGHLGKHIASGAIFISNLISWSEAGYFDIEAIRKPLLHLWSLGIEEQFYIVWPLLVVCLSRFKVRALPVFLLLFFVSFWFNIQAVIDDKVAAFFSPTSRAWELIAGAILAYVIFSKNTYWSFIRRKNTNLIAILGVLLILIAVASINKNSPFPGWRALLPVIGTILIISAGPETFFNSKILASRFMIWIGLISYPLYLWHWPIASLMHSFLNTNPSFSGSIAIISISFLFAWITYRFIECPLKQLQNRSRLSAALIAVMALTGGAGFLTYQSNGLQSRYSALHQDLSLISDTVDLRKLYSFPIIDCRNSLDHIKNAKCSTIGSPSVAIIGDSHSEVYFRALLDGRLKKGVTDIATYSLGSCPPALNLFGNLADCSKFTARAFENILVNEQIDTVFLSSFYGDWELGASSASDRLYKQAMNNTFATLRKGRKKIVFIIDAPALKSSAVACRGKPLWLRDKFGWTPDFCINPTPQDFISQDAYYRLLDELKIENPDVMFFDSSEIICPNARCDVTRGSLMMYVDDNHLSIYAARLVIDALLIKLSN